MKFRLEMPGVYPNIVLAIVVLLLATAMAIPASASKPLLAGETGNYRGECRKLTKQIDHYERSVLPLAISRGNPKWERATKDQIGRLWHRRADLCPAYDRQRTLLARAAEQVRQFNQMIATAAKGAAAFFSGGLTGGIMP
jgi:hypothetical protein